MASSNTLTDDMVPPRRPGIDDVGGGAKIEDTEGAADPQLDPTAADFNQMAKQLVAIRKVTPAFLVEILFPAGAPSINNFVCTSGSVISSALTLTDNGNGDTSITWAANTFPPQTVRANGLTLVEDVEIDRTRAYPITNGVRVKTKLGATGTDCGFVVAVSGG
jgi:hypothetical protein